MNRFKTKDKMRTCGEGRAEESGAKIRLVHTPRLQCSTLRFVWSQVAGRNLGSHKTLLNPSSESSIHFNATKFKPVHSLASVSALSHIAVTFGGKQAVGDSPTPGTIRMMQRRKDEYEKSRLYAVSSL